MNKQIESALLYISNHFRENIKLDTIAGQVGLSKYHFHRLFVKVYGYTPQNYLEKVRLEHAAHYMIVNSQAPMTEVAFECGFSSPACFSRAFKKFFSTSPSAYRVSHKLPEVRVRKKYAIPIQYLPAKTIPVQKVSLHKSDLSKALHKLSTGDHSSIHAIGFFLDIPVHTPLPDCRYYIGTENHTGKNSSSRNVLTMPGGYYVSVKIKGSFSHLKHTLTELRKKIYSSGYQIDSLTGYEKIPLNRNEQKADYFKTERELFIKVKRI